MSRDPRVGRSGISGSISVLGGGEFVTWYFSLFSPRLVDPRQLANDPKIPYNINGLYLFVFPCLPVAHWYFARMSGEATTSVEMVSSGEKAMGKYEWREWSMHAHESRDRVAWRQHFADGRGTAERQYLMEGNRFGDPASGGCSVQGYQMTIYYPFHSRVSDVIFIEKDKKSPHGNPGSVPARAGNWQ